MEKKSLKPFQTGRRRTTCACLVAFATQRHDAFVSHFSDRRTSQWIAEPTRISANSAKCLDLILTNLSQKPLVRVEHVDFTDHALVSCTAAILNGTKQHLQRTITRRKWITGKPNPGALEEALDRHMATLTSSGINEMWIEWRDKFTAALNEIAPRVTHTTKKHKSHCPWMTPELLHKIHMQKSLYRKVLQSKHQDLNAIV